MPSEIDVAWAAGFLDGDGYITHSRSKRKDRGGYVVNVVSVQSTNTALEPIQKLQSIFGGWIGGPYEPKGLGRKPLFHWSVGSFEDVERTIRLIRPYLTLPVRREQAAKTLRWLHWRKHKQYHLKEEA